MNLMNRPILEELLHEKGENLISMYIPTHPFGREQLQDPIRYGKMFSDISKWLDTHGMRKREIQEYLKELAALRENQNFWQHQNKGLAIFLSPRFLKIFRLPIKFEEHFFVGERFQIKPLISGLSQDINFFILALSQGNIRLLQGSRYGVARIALKDMPTNIDEAIWADQQQSQLQYHTSMQSPGGKGTDKAAFHGHGVVDEDQKKDIRRYFHKVDEGIMDLLNQEKAPLILAGVGFLLPIYREISAYPNIIDRVIEGNPDEQDDETLHEKAWEILKPILDQERKEALDRARALLGANNNLASTDLETIIQASFFGRIETLFVVPNKNIWGTIAETSRLIQTHEDFEAGDVDLLDTAAAQTLNNDGAVYVIEQNNMPEENEVIAIFRYALEE